MHESYASIKKEIEKMKKYNKANPLFLDNTVDFIRMHADRTHHGVKKTCGILTKP